MKYSGTACFEFIHLFTAVIGPFGLRFQLFFQSCFVYAESGFKEFDLGRKGQFIKYLVMANDPNFQRKTSVVLV